MFEDQTYDNLMAKMLDWGREQDIDVRKGSLFYDTSTGFCQRIAKFYTDLELIRRLTKLKYAYGEDLDDLGVEIGLDRKEATACVWKMDYEGTAPEAGSRFFCGTYYFDAEVQDDGQVHLVAELPGAAQNELYKGALCIPALNSPRLISACLGEIIRYGTDLEDDEAYRRRLFNKVSGASQNGNRSQFRTWCEEIDGVGRAKIFPLYAGENTVLAVIFDDDGQVPGKPIVDAVQEHVDPIAEGYPIMVDGKNLIFSDGLGEGTATTGTHFLAVGASAKEISVSLDVVLVDGFSLDMARSQIKQALKEDFAKVALSSSDQADVYIRYNSIGATIQQLEAVLDYEHLKLNGGTDNIYIGDTEVAVLGEVNVNAAV